MTNQIDRLPRRMIPMKNNELSIKCDIGFIIGIVLFLSISINIISL